MSGPNEIYNFCCLGQNGTLKLNINHRYSESVRMRNRVLKVWLMGVVNVKAALDRKL